MPYVSIFVAKILKLNDIAKKKGEKKEAVFTFETASFKGAFITDEENKNILVTPGNFHIGGGFKNTKFKYYNSDDFPSECILNEGDVVVTMTDLSKDSDTLGYSAKIPEIYPY